MELILILTLVLVAVVPNIIATNDVNQRVAELDKNLNQAVAKAENDLDIIIADTKWNVGNIVDRYATDHPENSSGQQLVYRDLSEETARFSGILHQGEKEKGKIIYDVEQEIGRIVSNAQNDINDAVAKHRHNAQEYIQSVIETTNKSVRSALMNGIKVVLPILSRELEAADTYGEQIKKSAREALPDISNDVEVAMNKATAQIHDVFGKAGYEVVVLLLNGTQAIMDMLNVNV